jgi:hypothetical protein
MAYDNQSSTPQSKDIIELMEAHRSLVETYGYEPAQEADTFSLAQPSPFRYVPTIATNHTAPLPEGE